jgi:L-ascorbate metabolism protein UlaG (beta-lactamase superfamily)
VADAETIAKRTGALLVANFEICMYYLKLGIKNIRPMSTGGSYDAGIFKVKCVNAVHASSFEDGTYGGAPNGFVISADDESFYHAGDTALTYDMKLIGEDFKLKFAMLPIGDNFTMGTADAIKACNFIGCNNVIAMHYDTFDLIKIDTGKVTHAFEKAGKEIAFIKIGETKEI